MAWVALKMLVGDKAKFLAIVLGLTFAVMQVIQQGSIFCGLMLRTCGRITDVTGVDLWVMSPQVRFFEDLRPMVENNLDRVRGVDGVLWAVPFFKAQGRARLTTWGPIAPPRPGRIAQLTALVSCGASQAGPSPHDPRSVGRREVVEQVTVLGLDVSSMVGGPPPGRLVVGRLRDLRRPDAIIVDRFGLRKLFPGRESEALDPATPDGLERLRAFVGREVEMNDRRAVIVGICDITRTYQSFPVVYTTYSRAKQYLPTERMALTYILAKTEPGVAVDRVAERIRKQTGLAARGGNAFAWITMLYYLEHTGISINFAITTLLGFLVGTATAGPTFYNFTRDNLRQFAVLKAMGTTDVQIVAMIVFQAMTVGLLGYGIGVGLATFLGGQLRETELAYYTPWQLLPIVAVAVALICFASGLLSILRVVVVEPAVAFRG
jgi:putative ABC transport system permease protein